MKILVATSKKQGERDGDFCHTREGEIVLLSDDCDQLHAGCNCQRSMVGAETGKGTTTMQVIESSMTREEFIEAVRRGEVRAGFEELLSDSVFEAEAGELLKLAARFPVGAVVERNAEEYRIRT